MGGIRIRPTHSQARTTSDAATRHLPGSLVRSSVVAERPASSIERRVDSSRYDLALAPPDGEEGGQVIESIIEGAWTSWTGADPEEARLSDNIRSSAIRGPRAGPQ